MAPWCLAPVASFGAAGWAASLRIDRNESARATRGPLQRAAWAMLLGLALFIASAWVLALARALVPVAIGACAAAALAWAAWVFARARAERRRPSLRPRSRADIALAAIALGELAVWCAFVVWRASILPPGGNDALSYHLPKAALLAARHGYAVFPSGDARLSTWPSSYELLLASALLLDGTDAHVAWLSVLSYVFFVVASGAAVERWWGRGVHVIAAVAVVASMPVALLHSGTVKNDLLVDGAFVVAIAAWAEAAATRSRSAAAIGVVAAAVALGTKVSGVMLVAGLAPALVVVARNVRPALTWRAAAIWGAAAATAFLLEGGCVYAINLVTRHELVGVPAVHSGAWGDFANLWRLPYLLFAAPFSSTTNGVWAPWTGTLWFWQKYDPFSSTFGLAVSLALALVPAGAWIARHAPRERAREHMVATAAGALAFLLLVPTRLAPVGFFCTFTRFLAFIVPVLLSWGLAPIAARWRLAGMGLALAACAGFAVEATLSAEHDLEEPLSAVSACIETGDCAPTFSKARACYAIDALAGPDDVVAIDSEYDAWIYACFGKDRRREVRFLRTEGGDLLPIPESARWVVVDRSHGVTWGHPQFTDFGRFFQFVGKGTPTEDELRVERQLKGDPHFRLAFGNPRRNQAVFQRVDSVQGPSPR